LQTRYGREPAAGVPMVVVDEDDDDRAPWSRPEVATALETADMPPQSVALYARWWQLETWLRELAYVELRALLGTGWADPIKVAVSRQQKDAVYTHMTGIDNDNPLAYLDSSQLVETIAARWDQFGYALLERIAWEGRQAELKQIRNRIGHLRAPHPDDLGRLEQTLRDLERGTFIALASYNRRHQPDRAREDPVTDGWIRGEHEDAQRLLVHAEQQYETSLHLTVSRRPWTERVGDLDGATGVLWHASFFLRGRSITKAAKLWHSNLLDAARPLIVHMLANNPSHIEFTFSAVDDGARIADAIGQAFEAVLSSSDYRRFGPDLDTSLDDSARWQRRARQIDYRVLSATGWNIVGEDTIPISNFGAGGGVTAAPSWP